jgi:hypothetical protein
MATHIENAPLFQGQELLAGVLHRRGDPGHVDRDLQQLSSLRKEGTGMVMLGELSSCRSCPP